MSQAITNDAAAASPARPRKPAARARLVEWGLIAVVLLYAAGLLVAPLVAIVWGSISEGAAEFVRQVTSADAASALKLTLIMAVAATAINTLFGLCIAWV